MGKELPAQFEHPYKIPKKYNKSVAYFSMEFGIDQSLKLYSGGLGYLAGSHMRSGYDLKQNMIGIGVLWKKGYFDQIVNEDMTMGVQFKDKHYQFLEDTGIKFTIKINNHDVWIKALYLNPETFNTVPIFFLSSDLPENDYLAQSTTHRLYDFEPRAKIASTMVLGLGGAKLLDILGYEPDLYHINEAHALSVAFHLYNKYKDADKVREKMVFTTHTPEEAGNEKHDINLLNEMSFFGGLPLDEVRELTSVKGNIFNHSLVALRLSHRANAVSKLHGEVSNQMWAKHDDICEIDYITNAQNKRYWVDKDMEEARKAKDKAGLKARKNELKCRLFEIVADQTGKLFDPEVFTIVWARRFAGYKRADLITRDMDRFLKLLNDVKKPVQIIFAGKPYPMDYHGIGVFEHLLRMSQNVKNMAVLPGYELKLSRDLKYGADLWLNNPRVTREASGTSGMSAAMNGAVNCSTNDGWMREFVDMNKKQNSFILPIVDHLLPVYQQDQLDLDHLYEMLEEEIIPMYYDTPKKWWVLVQKSMDDVAPYFDSDRMADEYYSKLYE